MPAVKTAQIVASLRGLGIDGERAMSRLFTAVREVLTPLATSFGGSATFDPAALATGASTTTTVTATGAALGDFVIVAPSIANPGLTITGSVTAASTVTVTYANNTAGAIDMLTHTIRVRTIPFGAFANSTNLGA